MVLVIDVSESRNLPGEPFTYHLTYEQEPEDVDEAAVLTAPVAVRVRVTYLNGVFVVDTGVRMSFWLRCARCLQPFEYQTEAGFTEQYDTEATADPQAADQNVVNNDRIDLTAKVRDTVLGAVPMKALCREDCPGLCMHCGASLADGPCDCSNEEIDPRLQGLARLLEHSKKKGVE